MNGEDDRDSARPGKNPFLDETGAPPVLRRRKVKPPPNIITAGGVDMARGHAVGRVPRDAGPEPAVDGPRVVIAVETDPRKVPTHRRLLEGREPAADGTRAALLPDGGALNAHKTPPTGAARVDPPVAVETAEGEPAPRRSVGKPAHRPKAAPPETPAAEPEPKPLPVWMRVSFAAVLLLLLVGVALRFREIAPVTGGEPSLAAMPSPPPPAVAEVLPESPEPAPPAATSASASATAAATAPTASVAAGPRATRPPAPPPRATFSAPFQLPAEKH